MQKLKIYLDNCCFNRPYDDQTQLRIDIETKAKLFIQQQIVDKELLLVSSVILEYENSDNPYPTRKQVIGDFLKHAIEYVDESIDVINLAREICGTGVKPKDATHLACAIHSGCDYFLSTDDRLLKYKDDRIKLMNPINFIMMEGEQE